MTGLELLFNDYRREFSLDNATEVRKTELIKLMQENLKKRIGDGPSFIICLDLLEHSVDSDNVEDLYTIDGYLREKRSEEVMGVLSETARTEALKKNKYGPNNPYPGH